MLDILATMGGLTGSGYALKSRMIIKLHNHVNADLSFMVLAHGKAMLMRLKPEADLRGGGRK
ncbi:hypothetical protein [Craterilacuibacter sp.]|uniref:hypothetical protein n=1 Tax=Craterilacuibacter sp. TaxID=2870909 RepID=UPI003F3BB60F